MLKSAWLALLLCWSIGSATAADPPYPQAQRGFPQPPNPAAQTQAGKFLDRGGRVFNVQAYGAIVDGHRDVTASFAAAFADALLADMPPPPEEQQKIVAANRAGTVALPA